MISVERKSLKKIRLDRLAMRRAFYAFLTVLAVLAVYRAVDPPKEIVVERPIQGVPDLPAQLFARNFTSAYLAYNAERPESREAALAAYTGDEGDPWAYTPPSNGSRRIKSTAIAQVYPKGNDMAVYVVQASTSSGPINLSVTVGRENGALGVVGNPAIVGAPASAGPIENPNASGDDVDDGALRTVVQRALTNWFAHQQEDLAADLSPDAKVSLPDGTYELVELHSLLDQGDGSVLANVDVSSASGELMTFDYEVNVERRGDRWTVQAIQTLPDWH